METTTLLQILVVIGGIIFLGITFLKCTKRRMTEEIGLLWSFFSILMIVVGAIPNSFVWAERLSRSVSLVLFGVAFFFLLMLWYLSIVISQLLRKSQELAIQVSLLNQENEQILSRLGMTEEERKKSA